LVTIPTGLNIYRDYIQKDQLDAEGIEHFFNKHSTASRLFTLNRFAFHKHWMPSASVHLFPANAIP